MCLSDKDSLRIGKEIMDLVDSTDLKGLETLANLILGGDRTITEDNQVQIATEIGEAIEHMDRKSLKDIYKTLNNIFYF